MKYKFYTKTDKVKEHHIDAPSCKQAYEQLKNELKEMKTMNEDLIARIRVYKAKSDEPYHHRPYELKLIIDKTETFKNINQDSDRNNISKANFIFKGLADNGVDEDGYDGSESNYSNIKSVEAIQLVNKDLHITYHNLQYEPTYRGRDGWEICGIDLTRAIMYKFTLTNNIIIRFDFQGMIDNEKDTQGIYFHNIIDKNAEINEKYKKEQKTKKLLEEILKESDRIIETSGSPIYKNPKDKEWEEIGLKPKGDFAYMVEFFSFSLVIKENYDAIYGDANSEYIEDAYALIQEVEQRAEKLRNKYSDKGVKVTVNGFNDGCEGGLAVYVWIPYQ